MAGLDADNKDAVAQYLREQGYKAANENGVVMVQISSEKEISIMDRLFAKIGYRCSKGYRYGEQV